MFSQLGNQYVQWSSWSTSSYILVDCFGRTHAIQLHLCTNRCTIINFKKCQWYSNMDYCSAASRHSNDCFIARSDQWKKICLPQIKSTCINTVIQNLKWDFNQLQHSKYFIIVLSNTINVFILILYLCVFTFVIFSVNCVSFIILQCIPLWNAWYIR